VGELDPNDFGLYDMLGNVSEWVSDAYGDYSVGSVVDPVDLTGDTWRVERGGSFLDAAEDVRLADRVRDNDRDRLGDRGFRVARTLYP
jgi:formylglycine-generating enzyme required for sulfatase activity